MHGLNNIRKGLYKLGSAFCNLYKLVLFENRVMRVMFELKTEEMGGKGWIMWSVITYIAC
jgi:hypothetical protein